MAFSFCVSHFLPQRLNPNLHPAKSKPILSQVLQRGAEVIYRVVDAEEAVVGVLERINGDGAVLCIVALQVERQLAGDAARIDLCAHTIGAHVEQGQYRVVHIVVEQDDAALGTADKVTDKGVGVKDLPVVEDAL